jgi:hypothetical protein
MRKLATLAIVCISLAVTMAGCATSDGSSKTEAQWAYNACAKSYNREFLYMEGAKAIVSGQDDSSHSCFLSSGAASERAATNAAMESCRERFARCYLFATGGGLSDWAQAINNNDGTDPAMSRRSSNRNADMTKVLSGVVTGATAGMQAGRGYQSQPTYGGYANPPAPAYNSGYRSYGSGYGSYGSGSGPYGSGSGSYGSGSGAGYGSYGSGSGNYGSGSGSYVPTYGLGAGSGSGSYGSGSGSGSPSGSGANCGPGGRPRVATGGPGANATC